LISKYFRLGHFLEFQEGEMGMKIKFGKLFWALFGGLSLLWIAMPTLASEKKVAEGKVAVVNGSVIAQKDFDRELISVQQRLLASGKSLNDAQFSEVKKNLLENLINMELLYQEAQKSGVAVDDAIVEEHLAKLKKQFGSEKEFKEALEKMNASEAALRAQSKKGLTVKEFVDKKIIQDVVVPDKEVRDFYDSHPNSFRQPEQVKASHILIKAEPEAKDEEKALARKKLKGIQKRVEKGEDFATLAKEYSEGPSGARGGDLGYFGRGQMVKPFEEVAFSLKPGEVSEIVETNFGYHLIKCVDKKPETTVAYKDIKEKLRQFLKQKKGREKMGSYIETLKKNAKIERYLPETTKK